MPGRHHYCRESPFLAFLNRQEDIARQSVRLARLRGGNRHGASSLVPRPSQCSGAPDQEALKNGPEALKIRSRVSDTHATRPPSQTWLARCGETGLLTRNYRGGRGKGMDGVSVRPSRPASHRDGRPDQLDHAERPCPLQEAVQNPVSAEERARMVQPQDCADLIRYIALLPKRLVMNEVMLGPTWNRAYVAAIEKLSSL